MEEVLFNIVPSRFIDLPITSWVFPKPVPMSSSKLFCDDTSLPISIVRFLSRETWSES